MGGLLNIWANKQVISLPETNTYHPALYETGTGSFYKQHLKIRPNRPRLERRIKMYDLYEIGFDHSIETEENLIEIANAHLKSYENRHFREIKTVEDAIEYFKRFGFKVIKKEDQK